MSPPTPITDVRIAEYLREILPDCQLRDLPEVVARVRWHMEQKQALVVVDEEGKIVGAALGRILNTMEEGMQHYVHHPEGGIVWVDLIATRSEAALPMLMRELKARWGHCQAVAGTVFNRNRELRVFPMNRLLKFIGG